jgi:hypothetical protein
MHSLKYRAKQPYSWLLDWINFLLTFFVCLHVEKMMKTCKMPTLQNYLFAFIFLLFNVNPSSSSGKRTFMSHSLNCFITMLYIYISHSMNCFITMLYIYISHSMNCSTTMRHAWYIISRYLSHRCSRKESLTPSYVTHENISRGCWPHHNHDNMKISPTLISLSFSEFYDTTSLVNNLL